MRALVLFTWMLIWGLRLADPIAHSLLHGHHEHCAEEGQHLHEGDDACAWSDPAYLVGVQPAVIGWELMPRDSWRNETLARVASAKNADFDAVALRGPPVG
ncbi:MAG: hypothetical protein ACKOX0_05150 [Bacteroidota bacterium]